MRYFYLILIILMITSSCSKKEKTKTITLTNKGKYVLLIFDRQTCPYCRMLHKDMLNNKSLIKEEKNFAVYFIHVDSNNIYILNTKKETLRLSSKELATVFGFRGSTPFLVFTDNNFKPIVTIPGYLKPQTLSKVFKYVISRAYQTMSLDQYISTP